MLKTFRTFSLIKIFRERVRTAAHTLPAGPEVSPHPLQPCQENKEYRTAFLHLALSERIFEYKSGADLLSTSHSVDANILIGVNWSIFLQKVANHHGALCITHLFIAPRT